MVRNSHHWRNSRVCRSRQSCDTSTHSVAPRTYWITHYKVGKEHPNGGNAQGSECTLDRRQATPGQWRSCSTHARATFHRNFTSSLMTFLRRCKRSPPTLMPLDRNGNTSAVSRSRRDQPNQTSKA